MIGHIANVGHNIHAICHIDKVGSDRKRQIIAHVRKNQRIIDTTAGEFLNGIVAPVLIELKGIALGTADQQVVSTQAIDRIFTCSTIEHIRPVIACNFVIDGSPDDVLEQVWQGTFHGQSTIFGDLIGSKSGVGAGKIYGYWHIDLAEVNGVITNSFDDDVVIGRVTDNKAVGVITGPSLHEVGPESAVKQVVAIVTDEEVVGRTSEQFFEVVMLAKESGDNNTQVTDRRSVGEVNTAMFGDLVEDHKRWRTGQVNRNRFVIFQ